MCREPWYSVAMGTASRLLAMLCVKGGINVWRPGPSMPKVDSFYMLGIAFQKCCVEEGKLGVSWFSSDPAIW